VAHPGLRTLRATIAVLLGAAHAVGCQAPAPAAAPAPVAVQADRLGDPRAKMDRVVVRRFRLRIELPDPTGWRPRKERSRFLLLDHADTGSSLALRTWLEYDRMTARTCEQNARLFRELPRGGEPLLRERRAIAGFDAEVMVAVEPGEVTRGHVTAFGAKGRMCLAFAFSTEARGPLRRQVVEDRLAMLDERTLTRLAPVSGEDDVAREDDLR